MAGKPSKYREAVYDLLRQGMTQRKIAAKTGASRALVYKYKLELNDLEPQRPKESMEVSSDFCRKWTEAVNRIRIYLGKPEFPMPKEGT